MSRQERESGLHLTPLRNASRDRDSVSTPAKMERIREVVQASGEPLEQGRREEFETRFGRDFSRVRVHGDANAAASARSIDARAYSYGERIVLSHPALVHDRRLMAHELAHVSQAQGRSVARTPQQIGAEDSRPEREADNAASMWQTSQPLPLSEAPPDQVFRQPMPAPAPGASPPIGPPPPELFFEQKASSPSLSGADARSAMDYYRKIASQATRFASFRKLHAAGAIAKLIKALSPADAEAFREEVQQLLRWLQETETRAASGMDDDKMAQTQATFVQAEAKKQADADAAAKAAAAGKAPAKANDAEVETARKKRVASTSIRPTVVVTWDAMSAGEKTNWATRGKKVVKAIVKHAASRAPELGLVEADFLADFAGVEKRGQTVLAYGSSGGPKKTLAVFGFAFVKAAEADPGYVMDVVVHEIFGHPAYGKYGSEYHLKLYDQAMSKVPGYVQPTGKGRTVEIDAYAYQETEMYAVMRGFPYHKDLDKSHQGKGLVSLNAPSLIQARVGLIKQQWEPGLAKALLRGIYQRYRADPRLTAAALDLFREAVKAHFDAATAAAILK